MTLTGHLASHRAGDPLKRQFCNFLCSFYFMAALFFPGRMAVAGDLSVVHIATESALNNPLDVAVRAPEGYSAESAGKCRIMVLFGGRNWPGEKTIRTYGFDGLADRHGLFLLSPSFKDDDYWEPEKWSGRALLDAVATVRRQYGLKESPLFYYGYSAGGQCTNLFAAWRPEMVEIWGAHACGVWAEPGKIRTPGFTTCGEGDSGRAVLSLNFAGDARCAGTPVVLKLFPGQGHELGNGPLNFARAFFESCLSSPDRKAKFVGDEQLMEYFPADSEEAGDIEAEFRNEFYDEDCAKEWARHEF